MVGRIGAVPAAMMVESAIDMAFDDESNREALKELGEGNPGETSADFKQGYLLGLRTARVMILEGGWSKESIMADLSASESITTEAPPVLTEAEAAEVAKEGAPIVELG